MLPLAAGVRLTRATSCDPEVVEIHTVVQGLSATCGRSRHLDATPSALSRVSLSSSVSESVSSRSSRFWYSSLLSSIKRTVSRCACLSGSVSGSINSPVCIVVLWGPLGGLDGTLFSFGEGEGLRRDGWWLRNVVVRELPVSFCCVPDPVPTLSRTTSRLHRARLPTRGVG